MERYRAIGTVYLFGLIPILRGLREPQCISGRSDVRNRLRPWVRWACVIRWKQGDKRGGSASGPPERAAQA